MEKHNLNMPGWMHLHKPDWYKLGVRFDHLIHDPRFWAVLALAVLLILMILTSIYAKPVGPSENPVHPIYPYFPP
jgi:hypothetical protein